MRRTVLIVLAAAAIVAVYRIYLAPAPPAPPPEAPARAERSAHVPAPTDTRLHAASNYAEPGSAPAPAAEGGVFVAGVVSALDSGERIAGARVRARSAEGRTLGADTDERGFFLLRGLAPGLWTIDAVAPGYLPRAEGLAVGEGAAAADFSIRLAPASGVEGVVVGPEGRPVEGALVTANPESVQEGAPGPSGPVATDPSGRFSLEGLAPGLYVVHADHVNYLKGVSDRFVLAPGARVRDLRLRLRVGEGIVRGRVADDRGRPVRDARVQAHLGAATALRTVNVALTDSDGRYEIRGLEPGRTVFRAEAPGYAAALSGAVTVRADGTGEPVDFVLGPPHRFAVYAYDSEGEPLEKVDVSVIDRGIVRTAPTDAEGRAEIADLGEGPFRVFANKAGYARATARTVSLDDAPYVLTLEPEARRRIAAEVVDERTGAPVARFTVTLTAGGVAGGARERRIQAPDGRFEIAGIAPPAGAAPDRVEVEIQAQGYGIALVSLPAVPEGEPAPLERVALKPGGSVVGVVYDPEGRPVAGARVGFVRVQGGVQHLLAPPTVYTDTEGRFTLEGVAEGRQELGVVHVDYAFERVPGVRVISGEATPETKVYLTPRPAGAPRSPYGAALNPYVGAGFSLREADGAYYVAGVFSGGPAHRAGLRAGDRVERVDGRSVDGLALGEVLDLIRGTLGTRVRLDLVSERHGPYSVEVERTVIY